MNDEGQRLDRKSLRAVQGRSAEWAEIAKDCVAFANASGGELLIGLEDRSGPAPGEPNDSGRSPRPGAEAGR